MPVTVYSITLITTESQASGLPLLLSFADPKELDTSRSLPSPRATLRRCSFFFFPTPEFNQPHRTSMFQLALVLAMLQAALGQHTTGTTVHHTPTCSKYFEMATTKIGDPESSASYRPIYAIEIDVIQVAE